MPPVIRTAPRTVTLRNTFRDEQRVMTFTCGSHFEAYNLAIEDALKNELWDEADVTCISIKVLHNRYRCWCGKVHKRVRSHTLI